MDEALAPWSALVMLGWLLVLLAMERKCVFLGGLNGKVKGRNSHFEEKWCFSVGKRA